MHTSHACVRASHDQFNLLLTHSLTSQVLRLVGPHVDPTLSASLEAHLPALCACVRHSTHPVRTMASACMAALSDSWLAQLMPPLLRHLVSCSVTEIVLNNKMSYTQLVGICSEFLSCHRPFLPSLLLIFSSQLHRCLCFSAQMLQLFWEVCCAPSQSFAFFYLSHFDSLQLHRCLFCSVQMLQLA